MNLIANPSNFKSAYDGEPDYTMKNSNCINGRLCGDVKLEPQKYLRHRGTEKRSVMCQTPVDRRTQWYEKTIEQMEKDLEELCEEAEHKGMLAEDYRSQVLHMDDEIIELNAEVEQQIQSKMHNLHGQRLYFEEKLSQLSSQLSQSTSSEVQCAQPDPLMDEVVSKSKKRRLKRKRKLDALRNNNK